MQKLKLQSNNSKRGFSFIEMIIVIVMLGVLASGIFPLFIRAIALNKKAKNKLIAYQVAQKEIETLRNTDFGSIYTSGFVVDEIPSGYGTITVDNDIDDDGEVDEIKEITAQVIWQEEGGIKNINFTTYVAKHGINRK